VFFFGGVGDGCAEGFNAQSVGLIFLLSFEVRPAPSPIGESRPSRVIFVVLRSGSPSRVIFVVSCCQSC
jgi:hypothetical protein